MKLNKVGLILCSIYLLYSLPLFAMAFCTHDFKGRVVFTQLALMPAGIAVNALGLADFIMGRPWMNSIYTAFIASIAIMYFIGCGLCAIVAFDARYREKHNSD